MGTAAFEKDVRGMCLRICLHTHSLSPEGLLQHLQQLMCDRNVSGVSPDNAHSSCSHDRLRYPLIGGNAKFQVQGAGK